MFNTSRRNLTTTRSRNTGSGDDIHKYDRLTTTGRFPTTTASRVADDSSVTPAHALATSGSDKTSGRTLSAPRRNP
ncbi:hypothetical protein [Lentzea sp. NEAU-D7]|uniref:hypothetical protein n=1 Tax=Lentzea sp. NEAU-D7 TaxID=2994667 RepID=UPI00224A8041|nr:hypothetical protein [Lentzea sp. NEAU-D7]MCX2955086.1 hypothetical protein [Lentzea sp. NEAU-D7]